MLSYRLWTREHFFLIVGLVGSTTSHVTAAPMSGLSQLGGWVYIDRNNDGNLAFSNEPNPEYVIGGGVISLFSTVDNVETLVSTTQTDDFGRYLFENINPGTYALRQTQSMEFVDGIDTLGILQSFSGQPIPDSASTGTVANNTFFDIVLTADVGGEFYNFGERGLAAGFASKRFLLATAPILTTLPPPPLGGPPPPPTPEGVPDIPEPTSLIIALVAGCGCWLVPRRSRGSKAHWLQLSVC